MHINCPKCGRRLRIPDSVKPIRVRCPACKHAFTVSPSGEPPGDSDNPETKLEWVAKVSIIVLALAGTVILALLVYKVANTGRPEQKENPPQEIARVAKINKSKPAPTKKLLTDKQVGIKPIAGKKETNKPTPTEKSPTDKQVSPVWVESNNVCRRPTKIKRLLTDEEVGIKPIAGKTEKNKPATKLPQATGKSAAMSPEELFAKASPAVVRIIVRDKDFKAIARGSGFFISADGLVVTNYHVIKDAEFATVQLSNNATLFVDGVAAVDPKADLAILKVNGENLPYLIISKEHTPKIGAKVYAIGNPKGLTNTLSEGIISGLRKINEGLTRIQTTAPISPGSSGGPLLNAKGEVLGVTTAYLKGGQNLNFAVPAEKIPALLKKRGKLQTLASAGGKRLDKAATEKLDKAWAAMGRKDWRTATKILIELRKTQKDNPFVWFALGYLHSELKNYEIAIGHYKVAITIKPDFVKAYINMGINYDKLKRYTEAIGAYKQAIAIKPDDVRAYVLMGIAYYELKHYAEAIAAYKKGIAIKPDEARVYLFMGFAYEDLKRFTEAIAAYKKAISIKPDDAEAYLFMGGAYAKLKRYTEAIAASKQAIAIKPDNAEAYVLMGNAYRHIKRHTYYNCINAITAYKKAISIKPDYADAYYFVGITYRKIGRTREAIEALRKYLQLEPSGKYAGDAREFIRLHTTPRKKSTLRHRIVPLPPGIPVEVQP